ncbi:hypothetical protein KSP40_PGU018230 [Platanthera guangdongensis]|uniref:Uncharacterized protein n=1 Tax=Platanthera guangdongensis TaxID=2320717 RepID=A0ABR2LFA1_9ASPA
MRGGAARRDRVTRLGPSGNNVAQLGQHRGRPNRTTKWPAIWGGPALWRGANKGRTPAEGWTAKKPADLGGYGALLGDDDDGRDGGCDEDEGSGCRGDGGRQPGAGDASKDNPPTVSGSTKPNCLKCNELPPEISCSC